MERRNFVGLMSAIGGASVIAPYGPSALASDKTTADNRVVTESRVAFDEMVSMLQEIDAHYLSEEWGITSPGDIADGHRYLMHLLDGGLFAEFSADPERPVFKRIVTPDRKMNGDNPDAIYFKAYIRPDREYRIRSNMAGAVYASISVEGGGGEGKYAAGVSAAINSDEMHVEEDGSFELVISQKKQGKNWLEMPADAGRITTRHYFEEKNAIAADYSKVIPIDIKPIVPPAPPSTPTDASIAAGIRRVTNYLRGLTLEHPSKNSAETPAWVSKEPNQFTQPQKPGHGIAYAAVDNAYAMAPYVIRPDQALVITGRFPKCRFAHVVLWNRFLQSYDYAHRQISLNRVQTTLEPDGSFRIIVAHKNPGVPNWIDTEGRVSGIIYWRFLLPEEEVETPQAKLVPFSSLVL